MSTYRLGAAMQVAGRAYMQGMIPVMGMDMVGLESGGYFQNELKSLHSEVEQLAKAIEMSRSLDPNKNPIPVTQEQDEWFVVAWLPFYRSWRQFYGKYAYGIVPYLPVVMTSRLEALEEYRRKFIALYTQAHKVLATSTSKAVQHLPKPSSPKKYQSAAQDLMDALGEAVAGIFKWVLIGGVLFLAFFFVRGRI